MWKKNTHISLDDYIKKVEDYGVGEILLNSIDRDGIMSGYDVKNLQKIALQTTTLL